MPPDNKPMVKLREHLLGLGGEELTLDIRGKRYLLVAPSEKKAGQIQKAALVITPKVDAEGKPTGELDFNVDNVELRVRALHACLFDPETRTRVFTEDADLEALRDAPVSAVRKRLMEAAVRLINPSLDEVEKNSSATPGGSSSSASPES